MLDLGTIQQAGFEVSLQVLSLLLRMPLAINCTPYPAPDFVALALVLGIHIMCKILTGQALSSQGAKLPAYVSVDRLFFVCALEQLSGQS